VSTITTPFRSPDTPAAANPNGSLPVVCKPEVMTITPEIAQEWTGLNTHNRPVRYARVAQLARDMAAGKWALNGESVKIATDGTIIDGQHRLYACIKAETPFETVVIRGLPLEVQDTVDTGASRKMSDQLSLRGEVNATLLAATARWAIKWLRGVRTAGASDQEPTHSEMLTFIEIDPRLRDATAWANGARQRFKSVNGSVYGMAWLLFHGTDHLAAEVFLEKVLSGEDMKAGHPALAFRNRIWQARENGQRLNQTEQLGYLILAWNAFKEDRPIARLQAPKGGKFTAKNFPEPK
jgi:hypothetical protein